MRKGLMFLCLLLTSYAWADGVYYRSFWQPEYGQLPLSWCEANKKKCGLSVAKRYCHMMGYQMVSKIIKANDIGLSRYVASKHVCDDAFCDGFSLIKCSNKTLPNNRYYTQLARKKNFHYPIVEGERLDHCYQKGKGCGRKAAYAFCRYQGYRSVGRFKVEKTVPNTRSIGSHELCTGRSCRGFSMIRCRR